MPGKVYTEYYGVNHSTGEIRKYQLPREMSAEEILEVLSLLNRSANIYGVTYFA